jgi:hypothetical protein
MCSKNPLRILGYLHEFHAKRLIPIVNNRMPIYFLYERFSTLFYCIEVDISIPLFKIVSNENNNDNNQKGRTKKKSSLFSSLIFRFFIFFLLSYLTLKHSYVFETKLSNQQQHIYIYPRNK